MHEPLTYQLQDGVAIVTLDDGKANVMSPHMLQAIDAALARAEADAAVLLLSGREGIFSGGFDLGVFKSSPSESLRMLEAGARLSARLLECPRPIVAAATGHAIAMGAFVLLCADVRIGLDAGARCHANEVMIGMTLPHFAIEVLRHRLTPTALHQAAATALPFVGAQAVAAGFLDEAVPAEALAATAMAHARRLAQLHQGAFSATKQRLNAPTLAALRPAIETDIADWTRRFGAAH